MFRRVWLLVAITTTVVLGPRLFPAEAAPEAPLVVALAVGHPDLAVVPEPKPRPSATPEVTVVLNAVDVTTTSTTAAPGVNTTVLTPTPTEAGASPTTSTTAPRRASTTATAPDRQGAVPPSTTSTTAAPLPATLAPSPPPVPPVAQSDGTQSGDVSWYELEGARSGVCAHRHLEKGTVVTVTSLTTGASLTCTVGDRGPYSGDGKILDLFRDDFARLAPLEEGVVAARLDW